MKKGKINEIEFVKIKSKKKVKTNLEDNVFTTNNTVKIIEVFSDLYKNIDVNKIYTVLEYVKSNLGDMVCGVIYLKEFPTQPFVSHQFKRVNI